MPPLLFCLGHTHTYMCVFSKKCLGGICLYPRRALSDGRLADMIKQGNCSQIAAKFASVPLERWGKSVQV